MWHPHSYFITILTITRWAKINYSSQQNRVVRRTWRRAYVTYVKIRDARSLFVCWTVMAACRGSSSKWFFTREQLENTPSRRCGVEPDRELSYRQQAANLIQDMGQRLNVYPSDALINSSRPVSVSRCDCCLCCLHTDNIYHFCAPWISVMTLNAAEIIWGCQWNPLIVAART